MARACACAPSHMFLLSALLLCVEETVAHATGVPHGDGEREGDRKRSKAFLRA